MKNYASSRLFIKWNILFELHLPNIIGLTSVEISVTYKNCMAQGVYVEVSIFKFLGVKQLGGAGWKIATCTIKGIDQNRKNHALQWNDFRFRWDQIKCPKIRWNWKISVYFEYFSENLENSILANGIL